jgi:hypothetical protein
MRYDIATCSFQEFTPDMGIPVPISVGLPNEYKGKQVTTICKGLRPFGVFNVYEQEFEYGVHYQDRMEKQAAHISADLKRIQNENNGQALVLMCWCNLHKKTNWCHRRMAAAWIEERTGLTVPELGRVQPTNLYPSWMEDKQPPEQAPLF